MTTKEAINILYTEATQENQTYSLDEINQAKKQLEKGKYMPTYVYEGYSFEELKAAIQKELKDDR